MKWQMANLRLGNVIDNFEGLGAMYASGGEFTENIDKAAGIGTAVFAAKAIEIYCR